MTKVGYARVSTGDQSLDPQLDILKADGCEKVFGDVASGKLARRPQLDAALEYMRPGDVLVITKLDRLGRSLHHLVELSVNLKGLGVGLRVVQQGIDTTTSGGRLYFNIMASIAEFERELISERTRDGLAAARARGRKGGRRPVLTGTQKSVARQMYDSKEHTIAQIAAALHCSPATIYRALDVTKPAGPST
jgi:DNA invertase Pin-like site-specific DNA recombinase